jgi:NAD(P)-dependent dehydrogenase (short-subunit alcohol dehydrogenase family)
VKEIRQAAGSNKIWDYVSDLSSLAAVRSLAKDVSSDQPYLTVLINNAGVGPGSPSEKKDP